MPFKPGIEMSADDGVELELVQKLGGLLTVVGGDDLVARAGENAGRGPAGASVRRRATRMRPRGAPWQAPEGCPTMGVGAGLKVPGGPLHDGR